MAEYDNRLRKTSWYLEGILSTDEKWIVQIDKSPFVIGRHQDCQLSLISQTVSRRHAEIYRKSEALIIRDLKSTNGTFINDKLIKTEAKLNNGDVIRFGDVKFKIYNKYTSFDQVDSGTMRAGIPCKQDDFAARYDLTKREEEILFLILQGKSTKDIAAKIFVSVGTAKNHILNIFKKTDAHSKFELLTLYNQYNSLKKEM